MDIFWLYKFVFCADLTPYTHEYKNSRNGVHLTHIQSAAVSQLAHRKIKKKGKGVEYSQYWEHSPSLQLFAALLIPNPSLVCSVTLMMSLSWVLLQSWLEPMWMPNTQNVLGPEVVLLISWRTWGFGPGLRSLHLWALILLLETGKNQSQSAYSQFSKLKRKVSSKALCF